MNYETYVYFIQLLIRKLDKNMQIREFSSSIYILHLFFSKKKPW